MTLYVQYRARLLRRSKYYLENDLPRQHLQRTRHCFYLHSGSDMRIDVDMKVLNTKLSGSEFIIGNSIHANPLANYCG